MVISLLSTQANLVTFTIEFFLKMLQVLIMFVFLLNGGRAGGNLCVTNVIVRMPRENDIGLIFGKANPNPLNSPF